MSRGLVLVADDDASVRTVVNQALMRAGYEVRVTSNLSTLWQWIEAGSGDCVVSDVVMPDGEVFDIMPQVNTIRPDLPVILISAQNTFMTAIRAQEGNAFEYLPKPFDLNDLTNAVERGIFEAGSVLPSIDAGPDGRDMPLVGRSPAMQEIYRNIARMRNSSLPVLLTGENGVGKTHIAQVIHEFSQHGHASFNIISLAGKSDLEAEREIFGDRERNLPGKINGTGTLFFSEVLDLPENCQNLLLRWLLDQREDNDTMRNKCRLIAATSGEIELAVERGDFRQDLYYRLQSLPLHVLSLRERAEDIPDLVRHFLQHSGIAGGSRRHMDADGLVLLKQANWPGNVVELENFVRRLCLLVPHETIGSKVIGEHLRLAENSRPASAGDVSRSVGSLREASAHFATNLIESFQGDFPQEGIYPQLLGEFEPPLIVAALKHCGGNQIRAAKLLGLNRNTLRKKIRHYGIEIIKTVN